MWWRMLTLKSRARWELTCERCKIHVRLESDEAWPYGLLVEAARWNLALTFISIITSSPSNLFNG